MSKSRGNVVDPWSVLDAHGADALRWYCYVASPAGNPRRFSERLVGEAQRRFLHTLWNTYAFFVTYANIDGWRPSSDPPAPKPDLDRWILSELNALIERETAALDDYDATAAARALERFVDVLSNWYVRRSRRRFWSSARTGAAADLEAKTSAYETLHTVLTTLARLLAPLTPYLAEEMWRNLVAEQDQNAAESVHLAEWPAADAEQIDHALNDEMALVQRVASLGRAARSSAGIRVRQPLAAVSVAVRTAADAATVERTPTRSPTNSTSNRSALPRPAQTRAATRSSPICECSAPASVRDCPPCAARSPRCQTSSPRTSRRPSRPARPSRSRASRSAPTTC